MTQNTLKERLSETWKNDKSVFFEGGTMLALFIGACFLANYVRENYNFAEQTSVQEANKNASDSIKYEKTILYKDIIRNNGR